jgi:signal transduction histidine kinase
MIGTITDITARHDAQALRDERDRAEAASRAKTEFVSRMSHELRTPLNAVLGFAQLLSTRLGHIGAEEQQRYLRHIEDGGWHLLTMVDDVLDLSRIESGQLTLMMQPVALAPLLQTVVEMMAPLASRRAVQVRLAAVPPGAAVQADRDRLRQVVTNLVNNAVKYNREGGEVVIVVSPDEGAWRVAVNDNGIGIAAEQLAHLFEPFNRLGHQNSAIEGTGLGLVLTRWYVDKMGGRLLVESREGVGSTFTVVLPRAETAAA